MVLSKNEFENPAKEFSAVPFWFWNDDLNPKKLCWQLDEMYDKGIFECIIHARKGMEIEYLSEDWFQRIKVVIDYAAQKGMKIWIYDEDNWPSGYAGGRVIGSNPDFAANCLSREKIYPVMGENINVKDIPGKRLIAAVAVYRNIEFYDITDYENGCVKPWHSKTLGWEVFVFRNEVCEHKPAYSGYAYVDLLNNKATEKFIEVTHREYKRRYPEHWGKTIKGFFTDEPGFYQNYVEQAKNIDTIIWSNQFTIWFQKHYGYDIIQYLCSIWEDMGDVSRKTRHDYYDAVSKMYSENFFQPIYDFCEADGLLSIGHVHQEEHLHNTVQMESHFFRTMKYLHIPGVDRINRERNHVTEKLGSSAAHMMGRQRCFSETYGCFGWELTPQEMKAEADWQFVQGINMLVPHAFYSSIEGVRMHESPPSQFYQNLYWPYYRQFADYIRRLSYALSCGRPASNILVYYPITSAWEAFEPLDKYAVRKLDESFIGVSDWLQKNQLDFDYIDDDMLEQSNIIKNELKINNCGYRAIIIPKIYNMPVETLQHLLTFANEGGVVISVNGIPAHGVDVKEDGRAVLLLEELLQSKNYYIVKEHELEQIKAFLSYDICDLRLEDSNADIMMMHRTDEDKEIFFLVNQSGKRTDNCFRFRASGQIEEWDADTGKVRTLHGDVYQGMTTLSISLEAYESKLIIFRHYNETMKEEELTGKWCVNLSDGEKDVEIEALSSLGLEYHSGIIRYKKKFYLQEKANFIGLDLGEVKDFVEVFVNGKEVGYRLWGPYVFDITDQCNEGDNILEVKIGNTMSNSFMNTNLQVGLFGPVVLRME